MAAKVARGEIKHQRIDGRMVPIMLKERRRWLNIAEKTAKTIQNVASNINEKELMAQLEELETLLSETKNEG